MQRNAGVKRLAVNPLLLTILCLIHRTGARLPERRIQLYEAVSETLLVDWRPAQTEHDECTVSISEADRLLAPLAHWMHEHAPRGLISEEKAKDLLRDYCATRHRLPKDHATVDKEIADFWHRLTYETSVFVERNPGEYAFLHLTFEEYWAARYLVLDTMQAVERLRAVRANPRFREVIRLAIASRSEEDAAHLIRNAIWCPAEEVGNYGYRSSLHEELLLTDMLLCVECLSDCASIEPVLARTMTEKLAALCLPSDTFYSFGPRRERIHAMLRLLRHSDVGTGVVATLLKVLHNEDSEVRYAAVKALGSMDVSSPEVEQALLKALQDKDNEVRCAAVDGLRDLKVSSPNVVQALLMARQDEHGEVRYSASEALGNKAASSPTVVQALLMALQNEDVNMRAMAAEALGNAVVGSAEVETALSKALCDEDSLTRSAAARALGNVVGNSTEVMQLLLKALQDKDGIVRSAAVDALKNMLANVPEIVQAFLQALHDEDFDVWYAAADALGNLAGSSTEVMKALLSTLQNKNKNARSAAARALGTVAASSPEVIQALLKVIEDNHSPVRRAVVEALGNARLVSTGIVQALMRKLLDNDSIVRDKAWEALNRLLAR